MYISAHKFQISFKYIKIHSLLITVDSACRRKLNYNKIE